jgi:glutamyl-tRNA reductase
MSFVVIGLNHSTAPLDVLEQVTVAPDDLDKALHDLSLRPYVSEGVVLSTCNRTEVYILAERFHGAFQDVRDFLSQISFVAPETLNDHLYTFYDDQAIEHLFRVSAGVDSAVLGEHEILGQIKRAWESAQKQDCVGMSLNSIFRAAVAVGKRVRTETSISRSIASVSQAAIVMAEERRGRPTRAAGRRRRDGQRHGQDSRHSRHGIYYRHEPY